MRSAIVVAFPFVPRSQVSSDFIPSPDQVALDSSGRTGFIRLLLGELDQVALDSRCGRPPGGRRRAGPPSIHCWAFASTCADITPLDGGFSVANATCTLRQVVASIPDSSARWVDAVIGAPGGRRHRRRRADTVICHARRTPSSAGRGHRRAWLAWRRDFSFAPWTGDS